MSLLFAITCILGVWVVFLLLFGGLGAGLLGLVYGSHAGRLGLAACGWAGYATAILFLQVWNLVLPVDVRALSALAALSLAGWLWTSRQFRDKPSEGTRGLDRRALAAAIGLGFFALWLADRAAGPCVGYDSATYHLTLVRWLNRYPVVPGLANLHPVYGLNLAGLLFPALLEQGPGVGRGTHFANGFVLFLFAVQVATILRRRETAAGASPAQIAAGLLIVPAVGYVNQGNGNWVTSYATDVPGALMLFAAALLALAARRLENGGRQRGLPPRLFVALVLLATAPAVKLTTLAPAALVWIGLLGWLLANRQVRVHRLPVVVAVVFALATAGLWIGRNVVLSGYPLYPSTIGAVDVDWRLPAEHAQGLVWWTRAYTRTPGAWDMMSRPAGAGWLAYWTKVELRAGLFDLLLPLGVILALVAAWAGTGRPRVGSNGGAVVLGIAAALAIPVWFFSAPIVRYGLALFWLLCAATAALLVPTLLTRWPRAHRTMPAVVLVAALGPLALHGYYTLKYRGPVPAPAALRAAFLTLAGSDHGFHPLHATTPRQAATCDGQTVFLPAAPIEERGPEDWPETLPWDGPLPITTLILEGLCPRRPGDLGAGFRIESGGRGFAERHAERVREIAARSGWPLARLAAHFCVRPELIAESLRLATAGE